LGFSLSGFSLASCLLGVFRNPLSPRPIIHALRSKRVEGPAFAFAFAVAFPKPNESFLILNTRYL
jgi:hypothetical protein